MGVEIEIEGGPQAAAGIQESVDVTGAQYMDQDSGFLYLANGSLTTAPPGRAIRIDKSNFLAVPPVLALTNVNDIPVGIAQSADGFVYVLARDSTNDQVAVIRIDKATFAVQTRFTTAAQKFPTVAGGGADCFIDGTFLVYGFNQVGGGPNFFVGRFDTVGLAFTASNVEAENFVCIPRNDSLNNEYYGFSPGSSGGCTPATTIVNKGTFTFTPLGGAGVCTNPAILIPYRWTPLNTLAILANGLID